MSYRPLWRAGYAQEAEYPPDPIAEQAVSTVWVDWIFLIVVHSPETACGHRLNNGHPRIEASMAAADPGFLLTK